MNESVIAVRLFFEKVGRAKYISALDLINCFQRALRRTDIPVWHTQGFNPHTYVNVNLPLALGTQGLCESMDIKLTLQTDFDTVRDKLNAALPHDIRIIKAALPVKKHTEIRNSVYDIDIVCDMQKLKEFLSLDSIMAVKKTKKGITELDIKPYIKTDGLADGHFKLTMPSGCDFTLNPSLLFDAYEKYSGQEIEALSITRTSILCADGEEFC